MTPISRNQQIAIMVAQASQRHMGRASLRALAERNVAKRGRLARQDKARRAALERKSVPGILGEPVKSADVPVAFRAVSRKSRRVVREAPPVETALRPVAVAPQYRPVKAADVPEETRTLAKLHRDQGDLEREWFPVGVMELDGKDVRVFARRHGASLRYSVHMI
ncbi:hypothetical protein AB0H73_06285 [Streptomyces olivoreticuli]